MTDRYDDEIEKSTVDDEATEDEPVFRPELIVPNDLKPDATEGFAMFAAMGDMRRRGTFCDISFQCQGEVFQAHRIVVSGWSRWLRGIIADADRDDIITLDVFEPNSFGSILEYMYGRPLTFTLSDADQLMKVIRRLELQGLEQHCWHYLLKIVNADNCEQLHELADKYSCPPLKLAAWRTLQGNQTGYATNPSRSLLVSQAEVEGAGHGLTGPEEMYMSAERSVSILAKTNHFRSSYLLEENENENEDPSKIGGPAKDIVKAWSNHLQKVYDKCVPPGEVAGDAYGDTYDDIDWYAELRHIYLALNLPQKVEHIPQILATWAGKEDKMIRSFMFKYRASLPQETAAHLEDLSERLINTRSVFQDETLMEVLRAQDQVHDQGHQG
jgi:hypothetical protein